MALAGLRKAPYTVDVMDVYHRKRANMYASYVTKRHPWDSSREEEAIRRAFSQC